MIKKLIILIVFVNCWLTGLSQIRFNKAYDCDSTYDFALAVLPTADGGYLMAGDTDPFGPFSTAYFVKLDSNGDTLWTSLIDTFKYGSILGLAQTSDGGYAGVGRGGLGDNSDVILVKLDKNGKQQWVQDYGGSNEDYGKGIISTADGGFMLLASGYSYTNGDLDAYLIKTDSLGNQQWLKNYGGVKYDDPHEIIVTSDGGYVFVGHTTSYGNAHVLLMKTDSLGNLLWQKSAIGDNVTIWAIGYSIDHAKGGGFIVCGHSMDTTGTNYTSTGKQNYKGYAVKTDSQGKEEWHKIYDPSGLEYDALRYIKTLPDGSYITAGSTRDLTTTPVNVDGWLMRINSKGEEIWSRSYTRNGGRNDDYIYDLQLTPDGGIVFCGEITNFGSPLYQDMWLVKTDCVGCDSLGCPVPVCVEDTSWHPVNVELRMKNEELRVFPNPIVNGILNIQTEEIFENIDIYNVLGEKVFSSKFYERVDLDILGKGIYLLVLKGKKAYSVQKIVVN